jgi:hypothetical protein
MLRKIFGSQTDEVSEQFRVLSNEQLRDSCRLPRFITIVTCGRLQCDRMREAENAYKILAENVLENIHLKD